MILWLRDVAVSENEIDDQMHDFVQMGMNLNVMAQMNVANWKKFKEKESSSYLEEMEERRQQASKSLVELVEAVEQS